MDDGLWRKIVDDLAAVRFAGRIGPYFYGEPLLDKRLESLVAYARARCPYAEIQVNTNGDYLEPPSLRRLARAGVGARSTSRSGPSEAACSRRTRSTRAASTSSYRASVDPTMTSTGSSP
jgi:MoaA/NifB/PqqE/SkfB family radical SAM enzyme